MKRHISLEDGVNYQRSALLLLLSWKILKHIWARILIQNLEEQRDVVILKHWLIIVHSREDALLPDLERIVSWRMPHIMSQCGEQHTRNLKFAEILWGINLKHHPVKNMHQANRMSKVVVWISKVSSCNFCEQILKNLACRSHLFEQSKGFETHDAEVY